MAIRPVDLQSAIFQAATNAPAQRQIEEAPHTAQAAAQAQFAGRLEQRQDTIGGTEEATGNRVGEKPKEDRELPERRKRRQSGQPFAGIDELAGFEGGDSPDEGRFVDFTA